MTVGMRRGKEFVEGWGEVGEFVSFSTAMTDAEECGMYAERAQMVSETGGSELRDECRGSRVEGG